MRRTRVRSLVALAAASVLAGLPLAGTSAASRQPAGAGAAGPVPSWTETTHLRTNGGFPKASPDGRWVYYQGTGVGDVYRIRPDGTGEANLTGTDPLTSENDNESPVLSGNGKKLAFASYSFVGNNYQVVVANADGSEPEVVSPDGAYAYMQALDDRGTKVVYANNSLGYQVQIGRVSDGSVTTPAPTFDRQLTPAFLPGGNGIIFQHAPLATPLNGDLYRVNSNGRHLKNLTANGRVAHSWLASELDTHGARTLPEPTVTPDGKRILYRQYDATGTPHLFTMRLDGSHKKQVTFGPEVAGGIYSPNGKYLAFVSKVGPHHWQLFVADARRTERRVQVSDIYGAVEDFDWGPGSDALYYSTARWGEGPYDPFLIAVREVWRVSCGSAIDVRPDRPSRPACSWRLGRG